MIHFQRSRLQNGLRCRGRTITVALYYSFSVPTMIAGIYGMNFKFMPELQWTFGYPLAMTAILEIRSGLYVSFKRSGWR